MVGFANPITNFMAFTNCVRLAEREAMWLNFKSLEPFAIKVIVGGVNAISGEPIIENIATTLRRKAKLSEGKSIQDYIVCGGIDTVSGKRTQQWLDGISTSDGKVMQFVATQIGSGYSIETQVTGDDSIAEIQFEVISKKRKAVNIKVLELCGTTHVLNVNLYTSVATLKAAIYKIIRIPPERQRVIFNGKQLSDGEFGGQCSLF